MAEEKEEKKEFLKWGEVKTMHEDLARLREIEAQRERERIAALKTEEKVRKEKTELEQWKKEKAKFIPPVKAEPAPPETFIPKIAFKKSSPFKKVLIRGVIVVVLLLMTSFFYWYFQIKKVEIPEVETPSEEVTPPTEEIEEIPEKPEMVIPPSLISVETTEALEILTSEELPGLLFQLLKKTGKEGKFTRVLIKDIENNKVLGLKEFLEVFTVNSPAGFLEKLDNDFTLLIYSSQGLNRLGLVAEIKEKEGLIDLLSSWETTLEKDTENLFLVLGKEGPAPFPYFRGAAYQGIIFRYLSFPPANFGICWSVFEDYFLWTSSGESMIKLIDQLITE